MQVENHLQRSMKKKQAKSTVDEAYRVLLEHIRDTGPAAVAFSGGTDSSLLLAAAAEALEGNTLAITIRTPYMVHKEIEEALRLTEHWGIPHVVIDLEIPPEIINNPPDRCYLCKSRLFGTMLNTAKKHGYETIMEGTNRNDLLDYRPGLRALHELNIRSPLLETGLDKETVRKLARGKNIPVWNKPASACLLTRLPHGTPVTPTLLRMIENAEGRLLELGFSGARVRVHGKLARIELREGDMNRILRADEREKVIKELKQAGFEFVTLDLEGYRMGSFNRKNKGTSS
ncbi:MAG TPA: ATP-dependent sacrificial sulfur transferase LarE [Bacteroidetes bacterium]|nr:ATP-dependent sacrificial sulfur transferase LarE [Bacteroidota bacterium]